MSFAIVAGAVIAGGTAVYGARQAANATGRAADAANAESARQYDQTRTDTAPLRSIQGSALDTLASLYGWAPPSQAANLEQANADVLLGDTMFPAGTLAASPGNKGGSDILYNGQVIGRVNPGGANGRFVPAQGFDMSALRQQIANERAGTSAPGQTGRSNMSAFFESPDYQFNLAEGQRALDRSLAARGRALSGAGVREGVRYASGMASNEFNNFTNRLLQAAGLGSDGVTTAAQAGMTHAGNVGANLMNAGNARASAYMTGAQGVNNAVQGGISNYLLARYLNSN